MRKLDFNINIKNNGDADAHNVHIGYNLFEFENIKFSIKNISNEGNFSDNKINWYFEKLSPEEEINLSFELIYERFVFEDLEINNFVEILSDESLPLEDSTTTIFYSPNINLSKQLISDELYQPLEEVEYKIIIENIGKGEAYDINVIDNFSEKLEFVSASIPYELETNRLIFFIEKLNPKETIEIIVKFRISAEVSNNEIIINFAEANSPTIDERSEDIKIQIECADISGLVFEDSNKNGKYDEGEKILNNEIFVEFDEFEDNISSDENGYDLKCIPFDKQVFLTVNKNNEYSEITTVEKFIIEISKEKEEINFIENNINKIISNENFHKADFGFAKNEEEQNSIATLSKTGKNINFAIVFGLLIILRKIFRRLQVTR